MVDDALGNQLNDLFGDEDFDKNFEVVETHGESDPSQVDGQSEVGSHSYSQTNHDRCLSS